MLSARCSRWSGNPELALPPTAKISGSLGLVWIGGQEHAGTEVIISNPNLSMFQKRVLVAW